MSIDFYTQKVYSEGKQLRGAIAFLDNAVLAIFWEGVEPRLGTLTVTLPDRVSSTLLGERDREIGLLLGERISHLSGKMALVSTNLVHSKDISIGRKLLDLTRELIEKIRGEEND
jgi:hypothetical protein